MPQAAIGKFRHRAPISAIFLFHGLMFGAWATQVPILRDRLHLSPAHLGAALFCISAGALTLMPATALLTARFGPRLVLRVGSIVACTGFVLANNAGGYALVCFCLLFFGMGFGVVDVAMNTQSIQVEQQAGEPILGSVHAMWSIGSAAGSAGGSLLLRALPPGLQAIALASLSLAAIMAAASFLGPKPAPIEAAALRPNLWRDPRLLLTGGVLCAAFVVEGAVADWGGVYLRAIRHVRPSDAALGYSAFSACMVVMRLAGDRLRARLGDRQMLSGALLACLGLAVVLTIPGRAWWLAGFGLAGLGVANVVPALFALAGASGAAAIAVVSTMGYAGVLLGPPAFGLVGEAASLPAAIGLIGVICLAVGLSGPLLPKPGNTLRRKNTFRHCR